MTFSAPLFLWALPAAAAPILIHLISLRRARRAPFPDLTLLRRAFASAMPKTRLRSWLLLAARTLLLLCLILAYAGPVLPSAGGAAVAKEASLDLLVLLDSSYSMGYREGGKSRFDLARAAAGEIIRALKPDDRLAVGVFSDRWEGPGALDWTDRRGALEALSRARLSARPTDFVPPLKAAYERLAGSRRRRALLLLSDGARHGLAPGAAWPAPDPGVAVLGLEWPSGGANAYAAGAALSEGEDRRPRLAALFKSAGLRGASAAELRLGDVQAGVEPVTLDSGRAAVASFVLPQPKDPDFPSWAGRVSLRPDALSVDDSYYFSFISPRRPRVLVLYGNPDFFKALAGGYFLRELLGASKESLLDYDADFLELSRMPEARLSRYQAVILADFKDVPPQSAAELDAFARRGGGLFVLPGARGAASSFAAIDAWLPARVGEPIVAWEARGLRQTAARWKEFELERVSVGRYHKLAPKAGAKIWLTSFSGDPLLVVGARDKGRVAVWASALDTAWSNLAVKPFFAAWAHDVLREIGPSQGRREDLSLKVDAPIVRSWDAGRAAPARVRVRTPGGEMVSLWVKDRRVEYRETGEPGLYWLAEEGGDAPPVAYAVNVDRSRESELAPMDPAPWTGLRLESPREDFWRAVYGRDARPQMIGAALFFLIVELLLAAGPVPGRRRVSGFAPSPVKTAALAMLLVVSLAPSARAEPPAQGDRFVWSQLNAGLTWDPYPAVPGEILELLSGITSVLVYPERRLLAWDDPLLFSSPFLVVAGRQAPPELGETERRNLRDYLSAGGTLWIEDTSGAATSSFDRWARETLAAALPEAQLLPLEADHVLFKTFFLLRGPAGRAMVRGSVEGVQWAGRTAVIYSRNDILGAWAKDALGRPLFACSPGGEIQRQNARKLAINILMYALTGSYKADAVHQPYLLQKMRSGIP